ncbi:MAG: alpha/beta hydrolase [Microbacterium sp.]|uniref:alpha/beta hydrolase n=1 Tax=Microbacterium sp. TaxID=51671 RepID=UPI0039E21EAC
MDGAWIPDILGRPFEQLALPLGDDDEGPVGATLVRSEPSWLERVGRPLADVDVLYTHGWSDYFFQTELARFWTQRGARFFALDLRKHGRSLRPGQTPGYVTDLDVYDADIAAALDVIGSRRRLVLMAHSTGGLTMTLWAARHPGVASALVLNSPWLELQLGALVRQAVSPLVGLGARLAPRGAQPLVDLGHYTRAQAAIGSLPNGPAEWRPARGFPTHPGWLAAVLAGHQRVTGGVDVGCPTLLILSARSSSPFARTDVDAESTDTVLAVDNIARSATRIGSLVTIARVDGAIHDVFLSRPEPRQAAYLTLERWLPLIAAAP